MHLLQIVTLAEKERQTHSHNHMYCICLVQGCMGKIQRDFGTDGLIHIFFIAFSV